eukprot:8691989-Pyramimonas_sp.AAC.1
MRRHDEAARVIQRFYRGHLARLRVWSTDASGEDILRARRAVSRGGPLSPPRRTADSLEVMAGHAMDLARRGSICSVHVECRRIMEAQASADIQRCWRGYSVRLAAWRARRAREARAGKMLADAAQV